MPKQGADKESTPKPKHRKSLSVRDVIKATHKDRIEEVIATKTNEAAGHRDWLHHHPAAVTEVMAELTEAEMEEAEEILNEWMEEGLPVEVQQR